VARTHSLSLPDFTPETAGEENCGVRLVRRYFLRGSSMARGRVVVLDSFLEDERWRDSMRGWGSICEIFMYKSLSSRPMYTSFHNVDAMPCF
jgi:hypothetical protein